MTKERKDQHPRAKEMGITEGDWETKLDMDTGIYAVGADREYVATGIWRPDAELITEAGNVMNRTGMTPEELVALLRDFRQELSEWERHFPGDRDTLARLKRTEGLG